MDNTPPLSRRIIPAALAALFAALLLALPEAGAGGISDGLRACYEVVIPSLFPFLFLTDALRSSLAGGSRVLEVGAALVLGLVDGFPVGARGLGGCVKSGALSRKSASALLAGAVNAGPAFLITGIGLKMLGSARAGLLLFISLTLASVMTTLTALLAQQAAKRRKHQLFKRAASVGKARSGAPFGVNTPPKTRAASAASVAAVGGKKSAYGSAAASNDFTSSSRARGAQDAEARADKSVEPAHTALNASAAAIKSDAPSFSAIGARPLEAQCFSLTGSLGFAVEATISLCGYVTLFSGVCAYLALALDALNVSPLAKALCFSALEVTSGCAAAAEVGGGAALYLVCAAVSSCGGCVLAQIRGICREAGLSMRLFFMLRPLHLALSLLTLKALLALGGGALPASLVLSGQARAFSYSASSAAALFALCVAFLLCERKFNLFTKG